MNLKFKESDAIVYEYLKENKSAKLEEILKNTNYNQDSIRRSIETLKLNGIIEENTTVTHIYDLDTNGKLALEHGFIEETFCNFIKNKNIKITEINNLEIPGLNKEDVSLAFGIAKRKELIEIVNDIIKLKENNQNIISKQKEMLLDISLKKPITETPVFQELLKRKNFILKKEKQNKEYRLLQIISYDIISDQQLYLTSEHLKSGEYKNITFKEFDVTALPLPKEQGRINPLRQVIYQIRELFLQMGFKEMQGPYVESCFWNMDSMFISQNHPARDIQDTFLSGYVWGFAYGNLTSQIAKIHNNGWKPALRAINMNGIVRNLKTNIKNTHYCNNL